MHNLWTWVLTTIKGINDLLAAYKYKVKFRFSFSQLQSVTTKRQKRTFKMDLSSKNYWCTSLQENYRPQVMGKINFRRHIAHFIYHMDFFLSMGHVNQSPFRIRVLGSAYNWKTKRVFFLSNEHQEDEIIFPDSFAVTKICYHFQE